jgi:hypothetical protein
MGMICIGNAFDNELRAVVGYDNYNGASIEMHLCGEGNWLTKSFLYAMFHYPFNVAKANVLLGRISSDRNVLTTFADRLGFSIKASIPHAHPEGDLLIISMAKAECQFLIPRAATLPKRQMELEL